MPAHSGSRHADGPVPVINEACSSYLLVLRWMFVIIVDSSEKSHLAEEG
jgi:hypothetical protein